jgi:hypothetical protein
MEGRKNYQAKIDQSSICVLDETSDIVTRLEVAAVGAKSEPVKAVIRNY